MTTRTEPRCHLSPATLDLFRAGELRGADRVEVLEHLIAGCPSCRRTLDASAGPSADAGADAAAPGQYGDAIQRLVARASRAEQERAASATLIGAFLRHPPQRQRTLLRNSSRYATWSFVDRLIDASFRRILDDPRAAADLCEQALELVERVDVDAYGVRLIRDLRARGLAHQANARRALGDLREAGSLLARARREALEGSLDPLLEAEIFYLEASLLRAQRDLPAALRKVRRARRTYREFGDLHREGICALNEYSILDLSGRIEESIVAARFATEAIDVALAPHLGLAACHNLCWALMENGEPKEALETLARFRADYERVGDRVSLLRRAWLEARILAHLDRPDEAERAYQEAIEGFAAAELPYEAASTSLDYSLMLFESGRIDEVARLAVEVLEIFRALGVGRESYAAWLLFQRSAATGALSRSLVEKLAAHFREARLRPELRFNP